MYLERKLNENTNSATNLGICWASFNIPQWKWWKYVGDSVRQGAKPGNLIRVPITHPQTDQMTLKYDCSGLWSLGCDVDAGNMESWREKKEKPKTTFTATCALTELAKVPKRWCTLEEKKVRKKWTVGEGKDRWVWGLEAAFAHSCKSTVVCNTITACSLCCTFFLLR